ncbi:MAG: hypothetical protein CBD16_02830 [Betaproteobacteria bacterium TMED156]|nr:MAG: hypothetical protein CBD16_02830 [Betaproteobacteria bacterium TMED156]
MNNIHSIPVMPDFYSIFSSFLLVLILLGVVLYILKKIQMGSSTTKGNRQIKIIEILPTNNKQKIMLIKVDDQQFLVGVSGQHINQLGHWTISNQSSEKTFNEKSSMFEQKDNLIVSETLQTKQNVSSQHENISNIVLTKGTETSKDNEKFVNLDDKENKISEIKQTEDLLSFAKKIRGSLNKSIGIAQRTQ